MEENLSESRNEGKGDGDSRNKGTQKQCSILREEGAFQAASKE